MTPETILALMVSFATPGQSIYSQTVVPADSGRACDNKASLLCAEPKANPAWGGQFTRPETPAEGLVRYTQIARIVDQVATDSTWIPVKGCPPPRVVRWQKTSDRCKALHKSRPWPGTADELKRYMLTIISHEGGHRRDVHSGRGDFARGDCSSKNPRSCRSTCLGQVMRTRRNWKSQRGYSWQSLTGLDDDATRRCLETVSDYLGTAKAVCTSQYGPPTHGPRCLYRVYGGVTSDGRHPGITLRLRTHRKFGKPPPALALLSP